MRGSVVDIAGKVFGRLKVLGFSHTEKGRSKWLCKCRCGNEVTLVGKDIKNGNTSSCGCLVIENAKGLNKSHGMTETPEYNIYMLMKARCNKPNDRQWKNYGGRGIKICKRWNSFEQFFKDMGERPGKGYSIERLNNNKGYCKANCVWATTKQQARNKRGRSGCSSKVKGVGLHKASGRWRARINADGKEVFLGSFKEEEGAISARKKANRKYGHCD